MHDHNATTQRPEWSFPEAMQLLLPVNQISCLFIFQFNACSAAVHHGHVSHSAWLMLRRTAQLPCICETFGLELGFCKILLTVGSHLT